MLSKETLEMLEQYGTMAEQLLELHTKISNAIKEDTGSVNLVPKDQSMLRLHMWSFDDARNDVLALATSTPEIVHEFIDGDAPSKILNFFIGNARCCTIVKEVQ